MNCFLKFGLVSQMIIMVILMNILQNHKMTTYMIFKIVFINKHLKNFDGAIFDLL